MSKTLKLQIIAIASVLIEESNISALANLPETPRRFS
jgi:hypothetical protein